LSLIIPHPSDTGNKRGGAMENFWYTSKFS